MKLIPLKIDIKLENKNVILSNMPMDSILARLHFDKLKNKGEFDGDYAQNLDFLKKSNGVYHTSIGFYEAKFLSSEFYTKQFDNDMFNKYGDKPLLKEVWNKEGGRFKNYLNTMEVKYVESITYYVCGNFDYVCELLAGLRNIGKKSSLGFGKVKSINVSVCEEDYSLIKDGEAMRHLPYEQYSNLESEDLVLLPLEHPYWKRGNEEVCILPKGYQDEK